MIRLRQRRRHGAPVDFTMDEFKQFIERTSFRELWDIHKCKPDGHKTLPSIDRIDNTRGYFLDNMQILTMAENARKSNFDPVTRKRVASLKDNDNSMLIIKHAVNELGGISALQRALVRNGSPVSESAIWQALNYGKSRIRLDLLVGIVETAFKGDWSVAGKLLEEEFVLK